MSGKFDPTAIYVSGQFNNGHLGLTYSFKQIEK